MTTLEPTSYRPTSEDRLWLLRAVAGEGEPQRDVASALVNRFVYLRSRGTRAYPTLADFVRAYAAPVNPRRMKGGDIWERLYKEARTDKVRQELLRSSVRRRAHSARNVFDGQTVEAVDRALLDGPRLPSVTDYAAHTHKPPANLALVSQGAPGRNSLYTVDPSWTGYRVTTERVIDERPDGDVWGRLLSFASVLVLMWGEDDA